MTIDLKTLTPDTTLPQTGFLFGADSQSSTNPSVYPVTNVKDALNSGIATLASAPAIMWDCAAAPVATVTLSQNATLYASNFRAGGTYKLIVFQDATGGRTLAYDPNFKWPNDVIPTVSTGANAMTVFEFVSNGTYLYGTVSQAYDGSPAPTVSGLFAAPTTDFTTLSTLSSMPTGGAISRNGNAMYYGSTGWLTYAPNNLLLYSADFRNTSEAGSSRPWSIANGTNTITANSGVAPDGTTTAALMAYSGVNYPSREQSFTAVAGVTYLFSVWVKLVSGSGATNNITLFSNGGFMPTTSTAFTATTDWQRITVRATATGSGAAQVFISPNYVTGATGSVYLWGAQLRAVTYQTAETADLSTYYPTTAAAYYGPRFDVDPATLQPKGLLVEGARSNLLSYSEDFSATGWPTQTDVVTASAASVSPTGINNSYSITDNANVNTHRLFRSFTFSGGATTFSLYVKNNTHTWMRLLMFDPVSSVSNIANFNIATGAKGQASSGVSSSITPVGGGWYRISMTAVIAAGAGNVQIVMLNADNTSSPQNYAGTGTSFFMFGAQIEQANFASSYMPSVAAASNRAADTFTITGYANRLVEAYWIEQETGVASSIPETVVSSGAVTINPPQFGWVTSLRAYTNAYAGDITTPSWIDNSGTNGNRMVTDSTGTLTWAPANMLTYSQDFGATGWPSSYQVTITGSQSGAPDGTSTATLVDDGTGAGNHQLQKNVTSFFVAGASYALSVYVKDVSRRYLNLGLYFDATNYVGAIFDLTNQTVTTGQSGTGYSVTAANMVSVRSGWFRCTIVFVWNSTQGSICLATANGTTVGSYGLTSYTGSNKQLLVWGAQLERVTYQTQPRAYIPTTSAAVFLSRYDYDASTTPATPLGMLIEESRTNLITRSNDITNAAWSVNFVTKGVTPIVAPDGTATAYNIFETVDSTATHQILNSASVTNGSTYTFSCYLKNLGRQWVRLSVFDTSYKSAFFDVQNGAVGTTDAGVTSSIQSVGNGWYRCSMTLTVGAATVSALVLTAASNGVTVFAGDTAKGVYIWGAQLEAGFMTSYIPTTTGTGLRVADVVRWTSAAFSQYWTGSARTIIAEADTSASSATTVFVANASNGTTSNRVSIARGSTNKFATTNVIGGSASSSATSVGTVTTSAPFRVGSAISASDIAISLNGENAVVAAATASPTVSQLHFGSAPGYAALYLNGHCRSLAFYNTRLPDAALKSKSIVGAAY